MEGDLAINEHSHLVLISLDDYNIITINRQTNSVTIQLHFLSLPIRLRSYQIDKLQ